MRICVYTYLLGSYDDLLQQPVAAESEADFICFTDDPDLDGGSWKTQLVEPRFPTDVIRSARYLKIVGDDRLSEYDITVCIDASVLLRQRPEEIVAAWLREGDQLALAEHSYRAQVLDEFDEVVRLNYDDRAHVHEQLLSYSIDHADVLQERPLWTGMLVRRQTAEVRRAMRLWFDHVLRFSRRDQLSVNLALSQSGLPHRRLSLDNFESEFHRWPMVGGRRIAQGKAREYSSGPLLAELRRSRRAVADIEAQLHDVGATSIIDLRRDYDQAIAERDRLAGEVEGLRQNLAALEELWRAAQGIRGASGHFARVVRSRLRTPSAEA